MLYVCGDNTYITYYIESIHEKMVDFGIVYRLNNIDSTSLTKYVQSAKDNILTIQLYINTLTHYLNTKIVIVFMEQKTFIPR